MRSKMLQVVKVIAVGLVVFSALCPDLAQNAVIRLLALVVRGF